jgi:hypothetical protein
VHLIFTGLTLLSSYWSGKLLHTSIHGFQGEENAAAMRAFIFDGFGGSQIDGNVYDAAGVV